MPTDLARLEQIFAEAAEQADPAARTAFLEQACADNAELRHRVAALLSAHESAGSFLKPPAGGPTSPSVLLGVELQSKIGRYKLLEQIGEGGFGVVFMAEQEEPVRRMVALKIIKLGMDTRHVVARFEAERQALAMMDHPNVAKVLDGGSTETGRPYFVMELVKGIPITRYCDEKRLSLQQRLELFVPVCRAVQHAHQKGVIHRDIKPTNVLVAEYDDRAVPKIIDFGVAKATAERLTDRTLFTEFGQVVGTMEYMSPEQAKFNQLDIDTRSDIYSLGVLLYELITGTTPFEHKRLREAALDEVLRIIREEEPPMPSTRLSTADELPAIAATRCIEPRKLSGIVRGDLDWIVMKALEKDRNRRYETANALAVDVESYLRDEPVQATSPALGYQLRKYLRRNKVALAFVGLLAAGIVALAASNLLIKRERDAKTAALARATVETAKAIEVAEYFRQLLGEANPDQSNGAEFTVRQLLDKSSVELTRRFAEQPEIEADIRTTIGQAYLGLDRFANADPHLKRAIKLRRRTVGEKHPLYAESLVAWAWSLAVQGQTEEATRRVRDALSIYRANAAEPSRQLAALRLLQWIDLSDSDAIVDQATQLAKGLPSGEHPDFASILHVHAEHLARTGRAAAAEDMARRALDMQRRQRPAGHPEIGFAIWTLGVTLEAQQKLAEAETAFREALDLFAKEYGPRSDVRGQNIAFEGLVRVLKAQSKHDEAASLTRERDRAEMAGLQMAKRLAETGRLDEALATLREVERLHAQSSKVRDELKSFYAKWGMWKKLADQLTREVELAPQDLGLKTALATVMLLDGRLAEHRAICHELLDPSTSQSLDALNAGGVAWVSLLTMIDGEDFDHACALADFVGEAEATKQFSSSSKALAEFRRGRFKSSQTWGADLVSKSDPQSQRCSTGWLIQALSYARLEQLELAQEALEKSDEISNRSAMTAVNPNWRTSIANQLLRREAAQLLGIATSSRTTDSMSTSAELQTLDGPTNADR